MTDSPGDEKPVRLEDAYALETPEDSRQLYARWAATYESGFVSEQLYVIPRRVAEVFAGELTASGATLPGPILDIGCGTGLAGEALAALLPDAGIDGADISPEMLAKATTKRRSDGTAVYRRLLEVDLTAPGNAADATYGGLLSSGTFTHGHLGPDVIPHVLGFAAPGALVALGINAVHFRTHQFAATLDDLVAQHRIGDLRLREVDMYLPGSAHFGETAIVALFVA